MTLSEIKSNPTFTDEGRQACSLLRQHLLMLQRQWGKTTPTSDLEEIGRRALIWNEIIEVLEDLMSSKPAIKQVKRKRLHNRDFKDA
jgi:hypothetical protein